jgi:hypothetical protein
MNKELKLKVRSTLKDSNSLATIASRKISEAAFSAITKIVLFQDMLDAQ